MEMNSDQLSHIDENGQPRMVDVSGKALSERKATAEVMVEFPEAMWEALQASGFSSKKGPVLEVARIAGTTAVKQTANLIPFCHPLPIEGCSFEMEPMPGTCRIRVRCSVRCTARTGVEMEAMTGASVAALTIYDMTKSLGLGTAITGLALVEKSGGKKD
jgi:cyclic pyranopterin phosphate synthase